MRDNEYTNLVRSLGIAVLLSIIAGLYLFGCGESDKRVEKIERHSLKNVI